MGRNRDEAEFRVKALSNPGIRTGRGLRNRKKEER